MDRRTFLTGMTMAGLAAMVPGRALGGALRDRAAAFRAALHGRPWLLGWQGVTHERVSAGPDEIHVTGRIPAELRGDLFRYGPAVHEVGGQRYRHWFDGDGMVQRFRFSEGMVSHAAQVLQTPKRVGERAGGRMRQPAFDTAFDGVERVGRPDQINVANTSVLSHGGRMMALWEGGSASAFDPETLAFEEFVDFGGGTGGLPFSAHTRTDRDGTLYSIGCAGYAGKIILYRIRPNGVLDQVALLDEAQVPMIHDFVITGRHIVLILCPWRYDAARGTTFLERHAWQPAMGGQAVIITKSDLTEVRRIEIPSFWAYHYGNGWEEADGTIHLDYARYDDPSLSVTGFRAIMRGEAPSGASAHFVQARLDPAAGRYDEQTLLPDIAAEFPFADRRRTGQRHTRTYLAGVVQGAGARHPFFNAVIGLNADTGAEDRFVHGPHEIAEEALFVPRGAGEADGWVLQTVLDFEAARTRLKIFDAARLADGPVAVVSLPYALPLGLHGQFVA